jgi:hypothetical protein
MCAFFLTNYLSIATNVQSTHCKFKLLLETLQNIILNKIEHQHLAPSHHTHPHLCEQPLVLKAI